MPWSLDRSRREAAATAISSGPGYRNRDLQTTGSVVATRNLLFVRLEPSLFAELSGRVASLNLTLRKMVWSYEADGELRSVMGYCSSPVAPGRG